MGKNKLKAFNNLLLNSFWIYLFLMAVVGYIFSSKFFNEFGIDYFYHAGIWDYAKTLILYIEDVLIFLLVNIFYFFLVIMVIESWVYKKIFKGKKNPLIIFILFLLTNYLTLKVININKAMHIKQGEAGVYLVKHNQKSRIACAAIIGSTGTEYFFYDLNKKTTVIIPKSKLDSITMRLKPRPSDFIGLFRKNDFIPPPPIKGVWDQKYFLEHKERPRYKWLFTYESLCGIEHFELKPYKMALKND
jgi:hypothetical protein